MMRVSFFWIASLALLSAAWGFVVPKTSTTSTTTTQLSSYMYRRGGWNDYPTGSSFYHENNLNDNYAGQYRYNNYYGGPRLFNADSFQERFDGYRPYGGRYRYYNDYYSPYYNNNGYYNNGYYNAGYNGYTNGYNGYYNNGYYGPYNSGYYNAGYNGYGSGYNPYYTEDEGYYGSRYRSNGYGNRMWLGRSW